MLAAAVFAVKPDGFDPQVYCNDDGMVFFNVKVQDVILPTSFPAASTTRNCHVPLAFPVKFEILPSGMKLPLNGAVPELMAVVADIVNTVLVKLSPLPPRRLLSITDVPDGEIKYNTKSPSYVWVMFTLAETTMPVLNVVGLMPLTVMGE